MVHIVSVSNFDVKLKVVGSGVYKITLRHDGNSLDGECFCPAFDFGPCKHIAATDFALIQYDY